MSYSMVFYPIFFLFLFFLFPFHFVTAINVPSDISSKNSLSNIIPQPNPSLIHHDALKITGDIALSSLASSNHWLGNGSSSNPFIISNYYINNRNFGSAGIFLKDVTQCVIIEDNYILANENGSVGEIRNLEGSYGIWISSSSNIIVRDNIILNQTFSGIEIDDNFAIKASSNILVTNNTILSTSGSSYGVTIVRSNNITLSHNIVTTQQYGIYVFGGENLNFSFNSLNFNFIGFFLEYIINSTIHDNIIAGNTEFGLRFEGIAPRYYVNDTLIKGFVPNNVIDNDFIANNLMYNPPNMSQALDVGKDDINNWNHNYWSNYPNSRISTGYAINRTIGLNQYSFDYEPSLQPNHANQNFVKSVEFLMSGSRTTANWYFTPLFFIFPFIFLIILKKRKLN